MENELAVVSTLFAGGLQRLHVRKPAYTADEYRVYLKAIEPHYHSRVVLCGGFDLWNEFELGGIHLNTVSRNNREVWETVKNIPGNAISASFHSWQEIIENDFPYGYVFISPVFDSISKQGYKAGIDLAGANELKKRLSDAQRYCPGIIGLGGVGTEQIPVLNSNGFDGAALLGTIWQSADPVAAFRKVMEQVTSL